VDYRTGKAFHIYRPWAEDATGKRVWCRLRIKPKSNEMTVTIPQKFLDNAVYPVLVDPTLGYNTNGASSTALQNPFNSRYLRRGSTVTPSEAGTIDSFHAYMRVRNSAEPGTIFLALSEEDSGGTGSHDEVASVQWDPSLTTSYIEHSTSAGGESFSASTAYVINGVADHNDFGNTVDVALDTVGSDNYYDETFTGGTFANATQDPWTDTATGTGTRHSIWLEYTASGGGGDLKSKYGIAEANIKSIYGIDNANFKSQYGVAT
jgi:hypothetical protein